MLSKLRSYRPSHGTVVAYIALFIALGGTSYGLATGSIGSREIKNNSIRSADIRNNTVRGKDVRRGTLRSGDVADHSLLARDFAKGQLRAGPQGPAGPRGPAGQDAFITYGAADSPVSNHLVPNGADTTLHSGDLGSPCPAGTLAAGGITVASTYPGPGTDVTNQVLISQDFEDPRGPRGSGMTAHIVNHTGGTVFVEMTVACGTAKPGTTTP
jgi:hypothetical protein